MDTRKNDGYICNVFKDRLENFVFTRPTCFILNNKEHNIETWVDLLDKVCVELSKTDTETFKDFMKDEKKRETRIPYLSETKQDIHFIKFLPESKLYLNQKIDAPRSVKLLRKMFEKFSIKENQFDLYIKAY